MNLEDKFHDTLQKYLDFGVDTVVLGFVILTIFHLSAIDRLSKGAADGALSC